MYSDESTPLSHIGEIPDQGYDIDGDMGAWLTDIGCMPIASGLGAEFEGYGSGAVEGEFMLDEPEARVPACGPDENVDHPVVCYGMVSETPR